MTLIDSSGNKRGEPQNITFRMFRKYLYNPTIIPNAPEFWFMLPEDADGNLFIAVYPTPDQAYSLNFQAYLDPITLAVSTDVIMFPPKYQNILWQYSRKYFELVLAEGQEPTLAAWLEPLLPELRILTKGPTENRTAVDIGIEINRDWTSRRGYDGCDWNHAYSPG
jgi:hypothetical protein